MYMIKVFLVEDEVVIRDAIKNSINWEQEGYEFVGEASDGELALPMILKEKPDILITDIRMPFMDGLELSRLVKKELPDTNIIILSGYDEFEYAKEAVHLEVEEYIYQNTEKKKKREKEKTADQLSKGNQQKIQLIAALAPNPELLILDEPLSGLDPVNAELFKSVIREEIKKNKFVIMSSHQMSTIEEFCRDIVILNKGRTVLQGNLNDIKKGYGRVKLTVKCEGDITAMAQECGLNLTEETPNGSSYNVSSEEQAHALLNRIIESGMPLIKYELREPSLNEIFIEKVGNAAKAGESDEK